MNIGILALGSHQERHGAALPPDTDAKIAEFLAKKVAKKTNTESLGVLESSYELPEIDTGPHKSMEEFKKDLQDKLEEIKKQNFEKIVLINAHGGNQDLKNHIEEIEEKNNIKLLMDNTICNIEGPHAGTGELSIGSIIGITDESKLDEHTDLEKHPEVGFAGFEKVQEKYDWARKHAKKIENEGVEVDKSLGRKLIKSAVKAGIEKVQEMKTRK